MKSTLNSNSISNVGRTACPGKAKGKAKVINNYSDLNTVENGNILIAAQTDMNMTPYMERCIGIITESGGRYCHAAIYSRENNIPCIVGVSEARKIIDEGMFVTLDADKRKIEWRHDETFMFTG